MNFFKQLTIYSLLFFSQSAFSQENDPETEKLLKEAEALIKETDKILDTPDPIIPMVDSLTLPIIVFSTTLLLSVIYYIYLRKKTVEEHPKTDVKILEE